MIDCLVIGWTIGPRPNADLVNTMFDGVMPSCQMAVIRRYIQTEDAITDGPDGFNE